MSLRSLFSCLVLLSPLCAFAQDADGGVPAATDAGAQPPTGEASPPPAEVSPEELKALQQALGQDTAATQKQQGGEHATPESNASSPATSDLTTSQTPTTSSGGFSLQSLNPDMSFIGDVAAAYFSQDPPLEQGDHDPQTTGFTLQQLELSVSKSVDPYFRFDSNIVFHQEGVEIEEAYATTLALPDRLQLRIGQFLTRFGRINNTHPHTWNFVDQPFSMSRVFGGEGNRGLGAEASWLTPLPWYVEVVGSITDPRGEGTARSFFADADVRLRSPLDAQYTGAVKQFFELSDDYSLLWGLSVANGPNANGHATRTDVWGTDVYLKYRPISDPSNPTIISLQAELLYRRRQVPGDLLQDLNGYAELFYRFEPRWGVAARYELGTPAYGESGHAVIDPLDPEWTVVRHRVSGALTFWPTEFSRIRLQGGVDLPRWLSEPDYSLMIAFEFAVGAHGAHAF